MMTNMAPKEQVLKNNDLTRVIESYLDIPALLSFRESYQQNGFFTTSIMFRARINQQWIQRYESYFGPLKGTHKCVEQKFRDTYEYFIREIKQNRVDFSSLNPALKDDMYAALIAIKQHFRNVTYISDNLKNNKQFMIKAIAIDYYFYKHRPEKFLEDRELALVFINAFPNESYLLPEVYKTDQHFIGLIKIKLGYDRTHPEVEFTHVDDFNALIEPPSLRRNDALPYNPQPDVDYSAINFRQCSG